MVYASNAVWDNPNPNPNPKKSGGSNDDVDINLNIISYKRAVSVLHIQR